MTFAALKGEFEAITIGSVLFAPERLLLARKQSVTKHNQTFKWKRLKKFIYNGQYPCGNSESPRYFVGFLGRV